MKLPGILNARGVVMDLGRPWTRGTVHQVLINPKYVGDNVWNRISFKLKKYARHVDLHQRRLRTDCWIFIDYSILHILREPNVKKLTRYINEHIGTLPRDSVRAPFQRVTIPKVQGTLSPSQVLAKSAVTSDFKSPRVFIDAPVRCVLSIGYTYHDKLAGKGQTLSKFR